jgi:CPA2 family monovalent cation:H+ antiporter-2
MKLPTIVGFILAGVLVGPSSLGWVSSIPNADSFAELAVIFLMFTIGLEFSFKRLKQLRNELFKIGFVQVTLTITAVAAAAATALDYPMGKAIFMGFLVSLSSTALVIKLLQDARDLETPYGKASLGVLLFQDLAVIPMMLALPMLVPVAEAKLPSMALGPAVEWGLKMIGVLLAIGVGSRYVVPFLLEKVIKTRSREVFFFCVLFLCFGIAFLFQLSGMSLSLGAFVAGMMISEGPYGRQVTSDIMPLRDNFLGLFFASVGMLLDLHFVGSHFFTILAVGFVIFLIKTLVVFATCTFNRMPTSISAITAFILCQIGEFSFILVNRGLDLGIITPDETQYFLSVSVLSMIFTPFLFLLGPRLALAKSYLPWKIINASGAAFSIKAKVRASAATIEENIDAPKGSRFVIPLGSKKSEGAHSVIIGFGIAGQNLTSAMDSLSIPYSVVELNYEAVKKHKKEGINIHFGDATRQEVLEHAGIEKAKLVIIAVSGSKIVPAIIHAVRALRPDVQIIVRAQYVRETELIKGELATDIVVAEVETTIELLGRTLRVYGVPPEDIYEYMSQSRNQLNTFTRMTPSLRSPTISLPAWEAVSSIRPHRIGEAYKADGKTLAELDLPRRTGTSVVSVFRPELGTAIPDGDFVLRTGDVVQIIGSPKALKEAEMFLKDGVSL